MHRPVVMGKRGMVSSAHYLASQAGLNVLRDGGNAMEAAITVNAVLNVVQPYACGMGGDVFFLYPVVSTPGRKFMSDSPPRVWHIYLPRL